jgi:hypothetical protein
MKKKLLMLLMLLMVVSPVVFGSQPDVKDRCTQWTGPYGGGVYYRYVQSYLGEDQWSKDYDCFQFKNENPYKVEILYYTKIGVSKRGPYSQNVEANTVDDLIALAPGERLSSIAVRRI